MNDDDYKNSNRDAIRKLSEALEVGMYTPDEKRLVTYNLKLLLYKLGLKTPKNVLDFGTALQVEGLDTVLRQVKFDVEELKKWKK